VKKLVFAVGLLAAPALAVPVYRCKLRDGRVDASKTQAQCKQLKGQWLVVPSPWPQPDPPEPPAPLPPPPPRPLPRPSPR
jgi:hypothetical protein